LILLLLALFWVLIVGPQRRRQRQQQAMLDAVRIGDEVLTVGGIYGIVQEVEDDGELVVEIADGIHVRVARRAVAGVERAEEDDDRDEVAEDPVDESPEAEQPVVEGDTPDDANEETGGRRGFRLRSRA
jgi:preprotein translocase subunit YajC